MILLALLACGVTENNIADRTLHTVCASMQECYQADFEDAYGDVGTCMDENRSFIEGFYDCYIDNCDQFDAGAASDCVQELGAQSCDEDESNASACDQIWSECDDIELGLCLADLAF